MAKIPMTREGFQKLEQELRDMRGPQLREHIQNLSEAKDKGDLSENAEYDVAKTALDDLNRKINNLSHKLADADIIEGIIDDGTVQLLTWVKFKNTKSGVEIEYRIVPENEIDMEYDGEDGRLWVRQELFSLLVDLFGKGGNETLEFIGKFFEYKFGVQVIKVE